MKYTFRAPGTCGELVQGTINNLNFSITCPINAFSTVTVKLTNQARLTTNDPRRQKILQAVRDTMLFITGRCQGAEINVHSQLPMAKGMASSTADIAAACMATATALGASISYHEVAKIALNIEPTDGLFFPGIVAFDHVRGKYFQDLGSSLDLDIMVFDFGGTVDTITFNQRADLKQKNKNNEKQVKFAYNLVVRGLQNRDPFLVAEGATISALLNQSILDKPNLEQILDTAFVVGALGINIAHSGTIFGVLFQDHRVSTELLRQQIQMAYPYLDYLGTYKLINGGLKEDIRCPKSEFMAVT